jgi:flagellar motor switch protein FliG
LGNIDGFAQALEALQALDESTRARILADLAKVNPAIAKKLREGLFSFSDLQYLLPADFKVIWWEIPRKTWLLALRKCPAGIVKMIESNISKRAFQEFRESLESHGPQPLSKVVQAQKEICDTIRKLSEDGKMALPSAKRSPIMV